MKGERKGWRGGKSIQSTGFHQMCILNTHTLPVLYILKTNPSLDPQLMERHFWTLQMGQRRVWEVECVPAPRGFRLFHVARTSDLRG